MDSKHKVLSPSEANDCIHRLYLQLGQAKAGDPQAVNFTTPLRSVYRLAASEEQRNFLGLMPSMMSTADKRKTHFFGTKCLSIFHGSDVPGGSHKGVYILFDGRDGAVLACLDAGEMTAIRTAASSAVAARALLPDGERTRPLQLGIIGNGDLARRHAAAIAAMFPSNGNGPYLSKVCIWGRNPERVRACIQECEPDGASDVRYRAAESIALVVRESDILCTVTSSTDPVIFGEQLDARPSDALPLVIIAVGASRSDNRELHEGVIAQSALPIVVDTLEGAMSEAGDLLVDEALAVLKCEQSSLHSRLVPLGDVVQDDYKLMPATSKRSAKCIIFKSVGFGALDLAYAVEAHRLSQVQSWV